VQIPIAIAFLFLFNSIEYKSAKVETTIFRDSTNLTIWSFFHTFVKKELLNCIWKEKWWFCCLNELKLYVWWSTSLSTFHYKYDSHQNSAFFLKPAQQFLQRNISIKKKHNKIPRWMMELIDILYRNFCSVFWGLNQPRTARDVDKTASKNRVIHEIIRFWFTQKKLSKLR
jgi:hypothetical protein